MFRHLEKVKNTPIFMSYVVMGYLPTSGGRFFSDFVYSQSVQCDLLQLKGQFLRVGLLLCKAGW